MRGEGQVLQNMADCVTLVLCCLVLHDVSGGDELMSEVEVVDCSHVFHFITMVCCQSLYCAPS